MSELRLEPVTPGRILIVEDDRQVAEGLQRVLEQDAHQVLVAIDVASASCMLGEQSADVVVCDIYMPGLTGLDLLTSLRRTNLDIEVILISGEPTLDTAREAIRQGAFDYLVKPISGRALRRAVADALVRKRGREGDRQRVAALEEEVARYRQLVDSLSPAQQTDSTDEGARIRELIRRFDGNLAKIARTLGMSRTTLYRRMKQLGIENEEQG